jgi:arginyl-tRNA synthetase
VQQAIIIRKRDGTYLYATTDLAAIKEASLSYSFHPAVVDWSVSLQRLNSFDWLVYVVDSSQRAHLASIFEIARRAGWTSTVCY